VHTLTVYETNTLKQMLYWNRSNLIFPPFPTAFFLIPPRVALPLFTRLMRQTEADGETETEISSRK